MGGLRAVVLRVGAITTVVLLLLLIMAAEAPPPAAVPAPPPPAAAPAPPPTAAAPAPSSSSSSAAAASPPAPSAPSSVLGLDARSFGAVGDGVTDDAAALQSAIDAAQRSARALLLPAGQYLVKSMLLVRCCERKHSAHNATAYASLRLIGEGPSRTVILSAVGVSIPAVIGMPPADGLNMVPSKGSGPATEHHHVSDLKVQAGSRTRYGILAPLTTRSKFDGLAFEGGTVAALKIGGWINSIISSSFFGCLGAAALVLDGEANSIDVVRSRFEGNHGAAVLINRATNVRLEANTIEGNGGPAVVANSVRALSIRSNYFEANLNNETKHYEARTWSLIDHDGHQSRVAICADIVVNSSPNFSLASPTLVTNTRYDTDNNSSLSRGILISGNSHTVDAVRCVPPNGTQSDTVFAGAILGSASGVVIQANVAGGCREHFKEQRCVVAVVDNTSQVEFSMNSGWLADYADWTFLGGKRTFLLKTDDVYWPPERAEIADACSTVSRLRVSYADALVHVLPPRVDDTALRDEPAVRSLNLAAAKQQRLDFQLVLRSSAAQPLNVTVAGPDPVGTTTPAVRLVSYANVTLASNAERRVGLFPDPLLDKASGVVPAASNGHVVFWVTLSIPAGAPASVTGAITIADAISGTKLCAVPYNVHVWNFIVPNAEQASQSTGAEVSMSYAVPGSHSYFQTSGIPISVVRTALGNMFDHRLNTHVFAHVYPPIALNMSSDLTTVQINTTLFDDQMEWLFARGMRQFRFPKPSFCGPAIKCGSSDPVHGDHKAENASVNEWSLPSGKRVHIFKRVRPGKSPICALNPDFVSVFRRMYTPVVEHLRAKGWLHRTMVVLQDEPAWNDPLTVCEWRQMAQLHKSLDPTLRIWQDRWPAGYTADRKVLDALYAEVGTTGTWVPDPLQYQADRANIALAAAKGTTFLSYDNSIPIIDLSPIRTRSFFWQIWRTNYDKVTGSKVAGLQGSLSWYGVSDWQLDPYEHANNPYPKAPHWRPAGLGVLVYPPWPGATLFDGLASSVRWEMTRAGLEDAEYLMMLLDKVSMLRELCQSSEVTCDEDVLTSTQSALSALGRVDQVVWDFAGCEWVAMPIAERRWNISEPYSLNTSLVHSVLDAVARSIEQVDRALTLLRVGK